MQATGITYTTTGRKADLRTVIVSDVRQSVVLLPEGSLDVVVAKLPHGSKCEHSFWAEQLGTQGDDLVIPASQIVAQRPMAVAGKPRFQGVITDGVLQFNTNCKEVTP